LIPRWALGENFQKELKKVLENPKKVKDLYEDIRHNLNWRGEAKNIIVMDYPDKSYIGKNLAEAALEHGVSDVEVVWPPCT